jgi:hypothetical protein
MLQCLEVEIRGYLLSPLLSGSLILASFFDSFLLPRVLDSLLAILLLLFLLCVSQLWLHFLYFGFHWWFVVVWYPGSIRSSLSGFIVCSDERFTFSFCLLDDYIYRTTISTMNTTRSFLSLETAVWGRWNILRTSQAGTSAHAARFSARFSRS